MNINDFENRILIAIAWLSINGYKITKSGIANYTGISRPTVIHYYNNLDTKFLLSNSRRYKSRYKSLRK